MPPLQSVTCQAAFYFYIDASNQCYMVLTLDKPGTQSTHGAYKTTKKGKLVYQETSYFAMDVIGSKDIISGTVQEAVMDDPDEQVKAAKDSAKLPLGRCSLVSRE